MMAVQQRVWVVLSGVGIDDVVCEGVFSTHERARDFVREHRPWPAGVWTDGYVVDEPHRRWTDEPQDVDYRALERELRRALQTEHGIRFCVLFGSMAHRDADRHSDIDLLVTFASRNPLDRVAIAHRLERKFDRKVDIIELGRAEQDAPCIVLDAIDHGRLLCDRDDEEPPLTARVEEFRRRCDAYEGEQAAELRAALRDLGIDDEDLDS